MSNQSTQSSRAVVVRNKDGLRALLDQAKGSIEEILPKYLPADRILKAAMVAAGKNPKLFECTRDSIAKAIMDSAQLQLDCSGVNGEGYLIPYKSTAQFIPGYRGLIKLARKGGVSVEAHVVYENDKFEFGYGLEPFLRHEPAMSNPGPMKCAYAVGTDIATGHRQFEVMTRDQLEHVRNCSAGKNSDAWRNHPDEMYRKTPVRRLSKYLPMGELFEQALQREDEFEQTYKRPMTTASVTPNNFQIAGSEPDQEEVIARIVSDEDVIAAAKEAEMPLEEIRDIAEVTLDKGATLAQIKRMTEGDAEGEALK